MDPEKRLGVTILSLANGDAKSANSPMRLTCRPVGCVEKPNRFWLRNIFLSPSKKLPIINLGHKDKSIIKRKRRWHHQLPSAISR